MRKNIGRYAVCGAGRIGKIEKVTTRGYFGTGIDGKPWFSRAPQLINAGQVQFLSSVVIQPTDPTKPAALRGENVSIMPGLVSPRSG